MGPGAARAAHASPWWERRPVTLIDLAIAVLAGVAIGAIIGVLLSLYRQQHADRMSERWRREKERDHGKQ